MGKTALLAVLCLCLRGAAGSDPGECRRGARRGAGGPRWSRSVRGAGRRAAGACGAPSAPWMLWGMGGERSPGGCSSQSCWFVEWGWRRSGGDSHPARDVL